MNATLLVTGDEFSVAAILAACERMRDEGEEIECELGPPEEAPFAIRHAPVGGVEIAGTFYPGGKFIPDEAFEAATPEEKAAVEGGEKSGQMPGLSPDPAGATPKVSESTPDDPPEWEGEYVAPEDRDRYRADLAAWQAAEDAKRQGHAAEVAGWLAAKDAHEAARAAQRAEWEAAHEAWSGRQEGREARRDAVEAYGTGDFYEPFREARLEFTTALTDVGEDFDPAASRAAAEKALDGLAGVYGEAAATLKGAGATDADLAPLTKALEKARRAPARKLDAWLKHGERVRAADGALAAHALKEPSPDDEDAYEKWEDRRLDLDIAATEAAGKWGWAENALVDAADDAFGDHLDEAFEESQAALLSRLEEEEAGDEEPDEPDDEDFDEEEPDEPEEDDPPDPLDYVSDPPGPGDDDPLAEVDAGGVDWADFSAEFSRKPARKTGRFKDKIGRWNCYESGRKVSCAKSDAPAVAKARHAGAKALKTLEADAGRATPKQVGRAAAALSRLTPDELKGLKRELGYPPNKSVTPEALAGEAARRVAGRELYAREARKRGVSPEAMADRARASREVEREYVTAAASLIREAKAAYAAREGKPLTRAHPAFRGGDWTQIRGFDVIARNLAGRYPELLGAHGYEHSRGYDPNEGEAYQRLYDLLAEGSPRLTPWGEHYARAIDSLEEEGPAAPATAPAYEDDVPFAAEPDPFAEALADLLADAAVPHECGLAEDCDAGFSALTVEGDPALLAAFSAECERLGLMSADEAAFDWVKGEAVGNKFRWKGTPPDKGTRVQIIKPGTRGKKDAPAPAAASEKAPQEPQADPVEGAVQAVQALNRDDPDLPAKVKALAAMFAGDKKGAGGMTKAQILAVGQKLGVTASGSRSEAAERIIKRAVAKMAEERAKEEAPKEGERGREEQAPKEAVREADADPGREDAGADAGAPGQGAPDGAEADDATLIERTAERFARKGIDARGLAEKALAAGKTADEFAAAFRGAPEPVRQAARDLYEAVRRQAPKAPRNPNLPELKVPRTLNPAESPAETERAYRDYMGARFDPEVVRLAMAGHAAGEKRARDLFGGRYDPGLLAAAANGQDGVLLALDADEYGDGLRTGALAGSGGKPTYVAMRKFYRDRGGALVVQNDHFAIEATLPDGTPNPLKGKGAETFATQVQALQALGVSRIETLAAGSGGHFSRGAPAWEGRFNGYYTWARLGYDGDVPERTLGALPPGLKARLGDRPTVQGLLALPGGLEAWKEYGDEFEGTFDLTPGSNSVRALEAYMKERGARGR